MQNKLPSLSELQEQIAQEKLGRSYSSIRNGWIEIGIKQAAQKRLDEIISQAKADIQKQQLSAADEYASKIPEFIGQETEIARRDIGDQLAEGQRGLRGNMSARGLLYSGQRLKGEAGLAGSAAQNLAQRRADTIRAINQTSQDLYNKPLASQANIMETGAQHQNALQNIRNQYNQAMSQQTQQLMGDFGYGVGKYFGGQSPNNQTPQTQTQTQTSRILPAVNTQTNRMIG